MTDTNQSCPECGAVLQAGTTCQMHFHQMLFWEAEEMETRGVVHHLMVLCYHLQHPSLYSPDGLKNGLELLRLFVEEGKSPQEVRCINGEKVASDKRQWKVTARPDFYGVYEYPVKWTMTAADVVSNGADDYCDSVRTWAEKTLQSLKASGNL